MAEELKAKSCNVIPGHSLWRQCVKKYNIMGGDQNESDIEQNESDNEYSCDTPRKKLNTSLDTTGISPVHLHCVAQHSRASTAKNKLDRAVEQKALELDGLHNLMKEKFTTTTYSEKIQILTLAPDSWSCQHCAEHFNVSEYLVRTPKELKKVKGILAKPAQKQGKVISQNTIDLVLSMYEDDEFSCQMPGKKDYVSIAKGVHKQKHLVLCTLREMYAAFKEKYPNVKLGFSKFCTFRPKCCVLAGSSGTHSACLCSIHQNTILLVDAINWDITYKDLISKIVCDSTKKE